jgi:photosystem II stability/assembly factor-like uncharacterized protein
LIGKVAVHPGNSNIVFAAALGNPFKPNMERGIFRSLDGGMNWEKVLFLNDTTGAIDVAIHPTNPGIIYAGMWRAERKPWTLIDGGETGGLYKSVDGGTTWQKVDNGLPDGIIGRISIAISPTNPERMWVLQAAAAEDKSGLYRSDDGGKSFTRICRDHKLRQRAWYYTHVFPDPNDENTVYICNVSFYKSIDGGKNFDHRFRVPHGDTHDLWINPDNPEIMINSNDGGACVSLNGGRTWSPQDNQPTSELYRLTVDNQWPYRLYAGQQDNSTISIPSRTSRGIHPKQHWYSVGGGESADVALHPEDPGIIYATTYSGIITRTNRSTGEQRDVGAYPHYTEGTEMRNLKYRWQWNFPIRISRHNPGMIYMTSNFVHRSIDEGQTWELISPDLTRAIDAYNGIPGGPVQHDATGVEVYGTIFAFEESLNDPNTLWTGSDDGRIHITRNGGTEWQEITPGIIPGESTINHINLSPHKEGEAYIAAYNYRYGNPTPYILHTPDFGKHWNLLTNKNNGIPASHFVRCITVDPENSDLLFAGTEFGVYVSFDQGDHWQDLQLNLPHTPITDMHIVGDELALSTQGRGFWILDHLNLLRELGDMKPHPAILFDVRNTYRTSVGKGGGNSGSPGSAPYKTDIFFYLESMDTSKTLILEIIDPEGIPVKSYNTKATETHTLFKATNGMNHLEWDLRYPSPDLVRDLVMMDMRFPGQGPKAPTGEYQVRLRYDDRVFEKSFVILKDPKWEVTDDDLLANYKLARRVEGLLSKSQNEIKTIRSTRDQISRLIKLSKKAGYHEEISVEGRKIIALLDSLEESIYQKKIEVSQDEINYPRKFTNHLIRLYRIVINQDDRPSGGELERWQDLQEAYQPFQKAYTTMFDTTIPGFIELLKKHHVTPIILKKPGS